MALTTPYSASFYVGDGETREFPYTFDELNANFIKVLVYNVSGTVSVPTYTPDLDLKKVVFGDETPTPTADDVVCIYRETPVVQDTPFRTLEGYNAKALENILSKIVAMIQEIKSTYFSTQVLQGDPWQLDLLTSADDGATVNIDYTAKKLVKGLYFRIVDGNLQVSADGSSYISMPKSTDIAEFKQTQIIMPNLTVRYKLQYRIGNEWYDAESNAVITAEEALQIANEAKEIAQDASDLANTFDGRITQNEEDIADIVSGGLIDNITIKPNENNKWEAHAVINKNTTNSATNPIYDWVGTQAEYIAQDVATQHPEWLCYITDDMFNPGDTYVFEQGESASTWYVTHNLNKYPSVTVVDSAGTTVDCTVIYINSNECELRFNAAFKGTAYLN